jgi:hypothetical protein
MRGIVGFASLSDQTRNATTGGFHAWLGGLRVHTAAGMRHNQWYAIATEFVRSPVGG